MKISSLIFATNNQHKADEIRAVLNNNFLIRTLEEAGILLEIPEPYLTLEENAREKSRVIYNVTGFDCFGEDTGLEVMALQGEPGVKSARYAGEPVNYKKNNEKLLHNMMGCTNRSAQFRTIISLLINGKEYQFEGICKGFIIEKEKGIQGFGYDPVFMPDGADKTFAEMDMTKKNYYSHRKKATEKFVQFLMQYNGQN